MPPPLSGSKGGSSGSRHQVAAENDREQARPLTAGNAAVVIKSENNQDSNQEANPAQPPTAENLQQGTNDAGPQPQGRTRDVAVYTGHPQGPTVHQALIIAHSFATHDVEPGETVAICVKKRKMWREPGRTKVALQTQEGEGLQWLTRAEVEQRIQEGWKAPQAPARADDEADAELTRMEKLWVKRNAAEAEEARHVAATAAAAATAAVAGAGGVAADAMAHLALADNRWRAEPDVAVGIHGAARGRGGAHALTLWTPEQEGENGLRSVYQKRLQALKTDETNPAGNAMQVQKYWEDYISRLTQIIKGANEEKETNKDENVPSE